MRCLNLSASLIPGRQLLFLVSENSLSKENRSARFDHHLIIGKSIYAEYCIQSNPTRDDFLCISNDIIDKKTNLQMNIFALLLAIVVASSSGISR